MRRSSVALAWALIAGLLVVAPARAQDPVLEIHRTEAGAHWDPRGTDLLFVLVIGSDVREGDPARGRADTLRLIALNPATMQGSTVGIPRDSYVNIPGRGMSKINASLQFGGPQLVVETVQALAGVPIHFWALVEFSRFRQLVDRLGGVTVNVPYPMNDRFSGANFPPGPHPMDGAGALAFARARYGMPGGDFGRSENHGRLLLDGLAKFRAETSGNPLRLMDWLNTFRDVVSTNVPPGELLRLSLLGRRMDPAAIRNVVLPGRPGTAGRESVVFLDPHAHTILASIRDDAVV